MEISRNKTGPLLVIALAGRLDANWCSHVQNALATALREGEHRIHLDMAEVGYVSSAGLRVLLSFYKQLRAIDGLFRVIRASEAVRSVLELAGLEMLLAATPEAKAAAAGLGRAHLSTRARYDIFQIGPAGRGFRLASIGDPGSLRQGVAATTAPAQQFGAGSFALGVGALGERFADCAPRCGEFLAVAGTAAFQPSDGSSRPDFAVSQSAFVPTGHLVVGLAGEGSFPLLARFEATADARTLGMTELAHTALELSGAHSAAFIVIAETAGLVGATLRQSPADATHAAAAPDRFEFPSIRDWLSFTSERAFRDSTTLAAGVVSRPGTKLDPLLRPLNAAGGNPKTPLLAHVHAAAFPYRPLRKGQIDLKTSVDELFDAQALQAVLHLLADPREFNGAGESEFYRGAVWIAPVTT